MDLGKLVKVADSVRVEDGNRDQLWAFLMICYQMPDFVKEIQSQLSDEDLYVDESDIINGFGLEKECHVTLFPCLDNETSLNDIVPYLPPVSSLNVKLVNISMFEQEDYNVLKVDVDPLSILTDLNSDLAQHFTSGSEFKDYHPHMTIAYVKKDSEKAKSFCKDLDEPVEAIPETYDFSYHLPVDVAEFVGRTQEDCQHIYFDVD